MMLRSGKERFTVEDLQRLSELVVEAWTTGAERDWSASAGTVEWSCWRTAVHAVDCVWAPAFFLGSRKLDAYPDVGMGLTFGDEPDLDRLVLTLRTGARILAALVNDADPDVRAVIFQRPSTLTGSPADFAPRAAMELILHAHDVCTGLGVPFEPPAGLCRRLREHTRPWPVWTRYWTGLGESDDPWGDLLVSSGRRRHADATDLI